MNSGCNVWCLCTGLALLGLSWEINQACLLSFSSWRLVNIGSVGGLSLEWRQVALEHVLNLGLSNWLDPSGWKLLYNREFPGCKPSLQFLVKSWSAGVQLGAWRLIVTSFGWTLCWLRFLQVGQFLWSPFAWRPSCLGRRRYFDLVTTQIQSADPLRDCICRE